MWTTDVDRPFHAHNFSLFLFTLHARFYKFYARSVIQGNAYLNSNRGEGGEDVTTSMDLTEFYRVARGWIESFNRNSINLGKASDWCLFQQHVWHDPKLVLLIDIMESLHRWPHLMM